MQRQRSTKTLVPTIELRPDGDTVAERRFHDGLVADGFLPSPICVLSAGGDNERRAEVFEEMASMPGVPPRFMVRLIVPGECEHHLILRDLPDLLVHFDRLSPVFAPLFQRASKNKRRRPRS